MNNPIKFQFKALRLPFKTTFKQASATRKEGESIWCEVIRGNKKGLGEGCPRIYVTQETVPQGLDWLENMLPEFAATVFSLADLKDWITQNELLIDQHPAAFCAIETALLDLFAQESGQSVEALLGLINPQLTHTYTAVLGDSSSTTFRALVNRYLALGFSDFKIKLSGQLAQDQQKLETIHLLYKRNSSHPFRVRLDANNLWAGKKEAAIPYLIQLPGPIMSIEEPIAPKKFEGLNEMSRSLKVPIILDESLCNKRDVAVMSKFKSSFIANLKVSKLGGIIRTLEIIQKLKKIQAPIIIGAHVGETSVLTRAGMCAAKAADESLLAQEGGFGTLLLEQDQVQPSLMFGQAGKIQLSHAYQSKTLNSQIQLPIKCWNSGWGLQLNT